MKRIIGCAAAVVALAAVAIFVPKASAANGARLPGNSSPYLRIERRINHVSGYVDANFKFRLEAKEGNPADVEGVQANTVVGMKKDVNDNKQVSADCTLNLGSMVFHKVGNYAFTLSEIESSDSLNYPLDSNKYDIFIQVTNVLDNNGEPTGDLNVELLREIYSYKDDAKVPFKAVFESDANYTYITLESKVSGAAADADKYFKYKVDLANVREGDTVTVSGQDSSVAFGGEIIETQSSYTVGSDEIIVYLKHGQTATIGGGVNDRSDASANEIPLGASYTVEKLDSDDGYATSIDGGGVKTASKNVVAVNADDFSEQNATYAMNSKDATVNTGVFATAWPYALAVALGLTGVLAFWRLSKRF